MGYWIKSVHNLLEISCRIYAIFIYEARVAVAGKLPERKYQSCE